MFLINQQPSRWPIKWPIQAQAQVGSGSDLSRWFPSPPAPVASWIILYDQCLRKNMCELCLQVALQDTPAQPEVDCDGIRPPPKGGSEGQLKGRSSERYI